MALTEQNVYVMRTKGAGKPRVEDVLAKHQLGSVTASVAGWPGLNRALVVGDHSVYLAVNKSVLVKAKAIARTVQLATGIAPAT